MGKKNKDKNKYSKMTEYERNREMQRIGTDLLGMDKGDFRDDDHGFDRGYMFNEEKYNDEVMRRMNNNYDFRRAMEAKSMSGDKDATRFAEEGYGQATDVLEGADLLRKYHKDHGNGGNFSSASDFAGLSYKSVQQDRKNFIADNDERYAAKSDLEQMEEADKGFTYNGADKEISPEMQEAKDRVAAYEGSAGQGDPTPYGPKGSIFGDAASAVYGGGADDQQAEATMVADSADKAQGFLAQQKEKMKQERNFKRDF